MADPKLRRDDAPDANAASRLRAHAPDVIDTSPLYTEADAAQLNRRFADADTRTLLRAVLIDRIAGDIAVVSSFGAESALLLALVAEIAPATPVLFLETGKHFPETLAYRDALIARLGLTNVINLTPDAATLAKRDENGLRWSFDPDGCCEIRKVKPLAAALNGHASEGALAGHPGFDATISGRKSFQSTTRAALPRFELDRTDTAGRLKVNPLIDWSSERIEQAFADLDLPRHPLVAQGYPSIGCMPCTSVVAPGEDPRAGRWRSWNKIECGIHVDGAASSVVPKPGDELPPGYEPVF